MRVAHIITRLILGGAQENTLSTVIDQAKLFGDEVTLITGPGVGPEGTLIPKAEANGVDLKLVPGFARSIRPLADWRCYHELVRLLREYQPEIVHTHSSKAGILGRMAARKLRLPCVHTVHGASFHHGQSTLAFNLYRQLERWAGPMTDQFICVCDAMTDQYVAAGIAPRERFTTVYSGFDVDPFLVPAADPAETRRRLGLSPSDVVIGKIGRLFHLKGHKFVLAAAPAIVRRCPNAKILFVGDGLLRREFEEAIREMRLEKHFVFAGLVPPEEVPALIHAMDIVVHTSEWEGLARVLPQGAIAGKPLVSYDIDGAREVVQHGETGFLLPRGEIAGLADAIVQLAEQPELRRRMGQTGRDRCQQRFRHEFMTSEIRKVFQRVLDEGKGRTT